jgi:uncharacterized membrane protein YbaN (DUF454 family)
VQKNARHWDEAPAVPTAAKALACVSLILWLGTILAAVDIPALTNVP